MQISGSTPLIYPALRATPAPAGKSCGDTPCSTPATDKTTELSDEEQKQLRQLQERDREVRAHEAAHKGAAGQYATSAASFDYQRGPDGRLYATGGEVGIDTSPIADNPEATLQKANQIRAAALAPAQPSGQDMAVAAEAVVMAAQARGEIITRQQEEMQARLAGADAPEGVKQAQQYQTVADTSATAEAALVDLIA